MARFPGKGTLLILLLLVLLPVVSSFAAVSAGEWVSPDVPEQAVLTVAEDGTVLYRGIAYEPQIADPVSLLVPREGEGSPLRCMLSDDQMVLFLPTVYSRHEEDQGTGFPGVWMSTAGGSSFIFTEDGRFLEDGVFTGTFSLDDAEESFTLHYQGPFEDTLCYCGLEGDTLTVEYPWKLRPAGH